MTNSIQSVFTKSLNGIRWTVQLDTDLHIEFSWSFLRNNLVLTYLFIQAPGTRRGLSLGIPTFLKSVNVSRPILLLLAIIYDEICILQFLSHLMNAFFASG